MSSTTSLSNKDISKKKRKNENNDKGKQKDKKIVKKSKIEAIEVDPLEITDTDKKLFPVVQLGARCECRHKCCDDLSDEDLQSVTQNIQNFSGKDEQDIYLQSMLEVLPVKNTARRTKDDAKHQKKNSFRYFIDINGEKKAVCKMAFLNLHGIGFKRCRRISVLKIENEMPTDKRCKPSGSKTNANSAKKIFVVIHPFTESSRKKKKSKNSGK